MFERLNVDFNSVFVCVLMLRLKNLNIFSHSVLQPKLPEIEGHEWGGHTEPKCVYYKCALVCVTCGFVHVLSSVAAENFVP